MQTFNTKKQTKNTEEEIKYMLHHRLFNRITKSCISYHSKGKNVAHEMNSGVISECYQTMPADDKHGHSGYCLHDSFNSWADSTPGHMAKLLFQSAYKAKNTKDIFYQLLVVNPSNKSNF